MTKTPDEVVLRRSLQQLDAMFGNSDNLTPASTAFLKGQVQNWSREKFIRGAYTYPAVRSGN
eukprot:1193036-Prorocentrum_minimum.AAC.2